MTRQKCPVCKGEGYLYADLIPGTFGNLAVRFGEISAVYLDDGRTLNLVLKGGGKLIILPHEPAYEPLREWVIRVWGDIFSLK